MFILILMVAVLVAARAWRLPAWQGPVLAALIWVLAVVGLAVAPGTALARFIGGDLRIWALGGGVVALVLGYRVLLRQLHRRAIPMAGPPANAAELTDPELDRYARHIVLRELGGPGQAALRRARVLVVGAGGLGAPVCLYLAGAGAGQIDIADDDRVSLSNLQRQVIFRSSDDGRPKPDAARDAMLALNPHIKVTALHRRITDQDSALIAQYDLVIDGTDSFAARAAINAACVAAGVPLIAGAIAQWEGQLTVWDPRRGAPCMACIFPDAPAQGLAPACAEAGVVGPLPGVLGSMMALEAIKIIAGAGQPLRGRMLIFDGLYGENRVMKLARRDDCPVCGSGHFAQG